ncbi:MAG: OmpH family outer membrane protein [Pirellulaceae bacterium]
MRVFFPATLVALATLVCLSTGFAQEGTRPAASTVPRTAAAPSGTNVAVIDIAYIFKNHVSFNAQMKQLETEAQEFQGWMQEKEKSLQLMKEGLKNFKPGSPDFQAAEEKLANEGTQYQLEVRRRQQEVFQKEAGIYYDSYAELEKVVATFAQQNKIGIVLKFNRDPIKRDDRNSVMQGLARPVVYHYGLDISNLILTSVNKGQKMPVTPTVGPGKANTAERPGTTKNR